jgi:phosphohistidine phosphatase SixA
MHYRISFRLLVALGIASFWFAAAGAHAQSGDQEALIEALQQGGYVVYMRHADTTGEPLDRTRDLTNRALQRNLSPNGRAQAAAIGAGIQRLELQVGHVAASPVFRARDTAELAFGADQVEIDPWLIADDYVGGGYDNHISILRQYLATPPEEGNTWLIGHVIPISIATSSEVSRANFPEGAAAVFRPENSGFELIGVLGNGWEEME